MKCRMKFWIAALGLFFALGTGYLYQHSDAFVLGAREDRYQLWMAALKGFQGTPRYVGSLGDYSYFRVGDLFCSRYKVPTEKLRLPRTFPLGDEAPYVVTFEMVPPFP